MHVEAQRVCTLVLFIIIMNSTKVIDMIDNNYYFLSYN